MNEVESKDITSNNPVATETIERCRVLLGAAQRLLETQLESEYTLNLLETTVIYDGAACDGLCLVTDIKQLMEEI